MLWHTVLVVAGTVPYSLHLAFAQGSVASAVDALSATLITKMREKFGVRHCLLYAHARVSAECWQGQAHSNLQVGTGYTARMQAAPRHTHCQLHTPRHPIRSTIQHLERV